MPNTSTSMTQLPSCPPPLSTGARILAWFLLMNGLMCLIQPFLVLYVVKGQVAPIAVLILFVSAAASIVAGFFGLRRQQWAFWLACLLFALQLVEYWNQNVYFSLVGPISLKTGLSWNNPPSAVNFNVFALLMVVLSGRAALQILEQDNIANRRAAVPGEA